ncbi:MAG TPA: VOC family protein [Burkholderiaceae bacterium]|nr:VOC family protein [Burkholderiaceae bacterium]HQR72610.1 VOC family protein [Burkholderiaceae bacterium]
MDAYTTHGAFSWSELMTSDPQGALRFYQQLLGWTTETMPMPQGEYHVIKAQGTSIGGVMKMPAEAAGGGMPPSWGCYVTVKDVDACAAQATALGGRVLHGPTDIPGVGRFAVIADPQGAWLNVITYAPPAK